MGQIVWLGISIALAVVGGLVLYFTFLRKSNDQKFKGFLGWMYDFLSFKKMFLEDFLRVLYLVSAIFVTLYSFALISTSFLNFILTLIVGNVMLRVSFELMLLALVLCRNTTNISNKITNLEAHFIPAEERKPEKKAKKEEPKEEAKEE